MDLKSNSINQKRTKNESQGFEIHYKMGSSRLTRYFQVDYTWKQNTNWKKYLLELLSINKRSRGSRKENDQRRQMRCKWTRIGSKNGYSWMPTKIQRPHNNVIKRNGTTDQGNNKKFRDTIISNERLTEFHLLQQWLRLLAYFSNVNPHVSHHC